MNSFNEANKRMVLRAATELGELCKEVVFLGGATVGLFVTDPAAAGVRSTLDVDVIIEVANRPDYYKLEARLRLRGFRNDIRQGAPLCRWLKENLVLDLMPTNADILGFSNRWYTDAFHQAQTMSLSEEITIRLVTAPYFLATKLEAFHDRGKDDYRGSADLEDIITVIDGRQELINELRSSHNELRQYVAQETRELLGTPEFMDALPGHLPPDSASQQRLPLVADRLNAMT